MVEPISNLINIVGWWSIGESDFTSISISNYCKRRKGITFNAKKQNKQPKDKMRCNSIDLFQEVFFITFIIKFSRSMSCILHTPEQYSVVGISLYFWFEGLDLRGHKVW